MKKLLKYSLMALSLALVICAINELSLVLSASGVMVGCISVASIPEVCGANVGGIMPEIYVISKEDVNAAFVVESDGITINTDIAPKSGKGWAKWDLPIDTPEFGSKGDGDPGSQVITQEINGFIPRMTKANSLIFQGALNTKLFVLVKHDGVTRLLGDWNRPVSFTYDTKSGKKGKDKKGTDFKFMGEGYTHDPYFYTGVITTV